MNLPIFKQMPYISYSTFMKWRNCQFQVYLSRLAGNPFIPYPETLATAVGTAFDLFIKDKIVRELDLITNPNLTLGWLMENRIGEEFRTQALEIGRHLATTYIELGLLDKILNSRVDVYPDRELLNRVFGVPILGIIDLGVDARPIDFKTRGFQSKAYATKGWNRKVDYSLKHKIITEIFEARKPDEHALEKNNIPWAIQMLFYNWLLQGSLDTSAKMRTEKIPYHVEELCKHGDTISFVTHKGFLSKEFENEIAEEVVQCWDSVSSNMYNAEIKEPSPKRSMCEKFNKICDVAHWCKFYKHTLGDPKRRDSYV